MAVVPRKIQSDIRAAPISGEKLRPVRTGAIGDAFAEGMKGAGGALMQYEITQDELQDNADKLAARNLALGFKAKADAKTTEFKQMRGVNAVNASGQVQTDLTTLETEVLDSTANPRQRAYLQPLISAAQPDYINGVYTHSKQQQFVYSNDTYAAEAKAGAQDAARDYADPEKQAVRFEEMDVAVDRLGVLNGWSDEVKADKKRELRSASHLQVIDTMLVTPDADVGKAAGYLEQHKGDMSEVDYAKAAGALQEPLQFRQARSDIAGISFDAPSPASDGSIPGATPGVGADTGYNPAQLKGLIKAPESRGKRNAVNGMGSSASGLYQFIHDTFVGTYNRVNGSGGEAQWQKDRFDPDVQEKLMDRLMKDNEGVLRGAKLPVNNGTMYLMHVLGSKDGPRLLKADPNAPVSDVLSAEIIRKNPTYFGPINGKPRTVGQAINKVTGIVGGGGGDSYSAAAPLPDRGAGYDEIERRGKEQGWTPERIERAKKTYDVEYQRRDRVRSEQQGAAGQSAMQTIFSLGDGFTSTNQLPREVREKMSPDMLLKAEEQAQRNLQAKNTMPDDNARSLELQRLSREDPNAFAGVNLGNEIGNVSQGDLKGLWLKQGDIKGQQTKDRQNDDTRQGITGAITFGSKHSGYLVSDKDWPRVYDYMDAELSVKRDKQGFLTPQDYTDSFNHAIQVGPHAGGKQNYKVVTFEGGGAALPASFQMPFISDFKQRRGREPNRAEILKGWTLLSGPERQKFLER